MEPKNPEASGQQQDTNQDSASEDWTTVSSGGRTPEEIEAFWRNRISQKDRGHLAAERALREQNESLDRQLKQLVATPQANGQPGQVPEVFQAQFSELQRQLEAERAARVVEQRKAKFPALAAQVVDDSVFRTADDATLAKFNALADDSASGSFIAPTQPRRAAPAAQKPLREKTKEELLDDLRRLEPAYIEWQRTQR